MATMTNEEYQRFQDRAKAERFAILKEAAKAKRGVLLKDVPPCDLAAWADYLECDLRIEFDDLEKDAGNKIRYLKYASGKQVEALRLRLPHRRIVIHSTGRIPERYPVCFEDKILYKILEQAVTDPAKYISDPRQFPSWLLFHPFGDIFHEGMTWAAFMAECERWLQGYRDGKVTWQRLLKRMADVRSSNLFVNNTERLDEFERFRQQIIYENT